MRPQNSGHPGFVDRWSMGRPCPDRRCRIHRECIRMTAGRNGGRTHRGRSTDGPGIFGWRGGHSRHSPVSHRQPSYLWYPDRCRRQNDFPKSRISPFRVDHGDGCLADPTTMIRFDGQRMKVACRSWIKSDYWISTSAGAIRFGFSASDSLGNEIDRSCHPRWRKIPEKGGWPTTLPTSLTAC